MLIMIMTLGVLVVKGVGADASIYKSGKMEIKCDYSCTQDVNTVEADVIYHNMVSPVSVNWILTDNYFYVKDPLKEHIAYVATNGRFEDTLFEGYLKPPNAMKGINNHSPTDKGKTKVTAGGSGGMPGIQEGYSM